MTENMFDVGGWQPFRWLEGGNGFGCARSNYGSPTMQILETLMASPICLSLNTWRVILTPENPTLFHLFVTARD